MKKNAFLKYGKYIIPIIIIAVVAYLIYYNNKTECEVTIEDIVLTVFNKESVTEKDMEFIYEGIYPETTTQSWPISKSTDGEYGNSMDFSVKFIGKKDENNGCYIVPSVNLTDEAKDLFLVRYCSNSDLRVYDGQAMGAIYLLGCARTYSGEEVIEILKQCSIDISIYTENGELLEKKHLNLEETEIKLEYSDEETGTAFGLSSYTN